MIVFKLCQQVPWELKNQIKTTQNCLSSLKFSQISSGQNKNRSKKSSQDLICPPKNKKNAFFKQNDVRKIILESKPTTRGGWCLEKKRKLRRQNQESRKKDSLFY